MPRGTQCHVAPNATWHPSPRLVATGVSVLDSVAPAWRRRRVETAAALVRSEDPGVEIPQAAAALVRSEGPGVEIPQAAAALVRCPGTGARALVHWWPATGGQPLVAGHWCPATGARPLSEDPAAGVPAVPVVPYENGRAGVPGQTHLPSFSAASQASDSALGRAQSTEL